MANKYIPLMLRHSSTPRIEAFALLAGLEAAVRGTLISVMPLVVYEAVKDAARRRLRGMYETAEKQLEGRDWLAGFRSFADPYFYITLRWADRTGVDLSGLPNIAAFKQRMEADAGVQAALKAEGLA